MSQLKVLDLHGTEIALLPSSLSNLIYLKALYLNSCSKLEEIPSSVKALTCLEVLDIRKTKLNLLQIGSLVSLKCLRLSLCNFDMANYTKAQVSTFDLLEELNIDVVDCLGVFVQEWPVWEEGSLTFHFAIGCHNSVFTQILESIDHPGHNILKLANGDDVNPVIMSKIKTIIDGDRVSEAVLQSLENLHITDVPNLKNIWQGPVQARSMIQQFLRLKHLRVEECYQIEKIIMESKNTQLENQGLPELKTIVLFDLPKLTSIWAKDSLQWPFLQEVKISKCSQLKSLPFNKVIH
ncbi:hypothetical protein CK203_023796 [Vitis vinifera]|uniref:Disease resistance protein At4g27190-like leucine-rich repeats domain-containing protein n=1 Tax=Vitis vinifera TaxID=29760 RepID=A0A438JAE1_VITVI|nr:hypothetical protein CK203_023796 [Vitis vinifera]